MFTKRKSEETGIENVKKMKMNFSLYIEREREKIMLEKESSESIRNYLSESLRSLENFSTAFSFDPYSGFAGFGICITPDINGFQPPTCPFNMTISSSSPSHGHPSGPVGLSQTTAGSYQNSCQHHQTQNINMGPDLMGRSHFHDASTSTVSDSSLVAQLIDVVREWNLDLYEKCMDDYIFLRGNNPEFWDRMILKALPPAMVEHHVKADIVADFFHTMCKDFKRITALVKIKPSYLQFFLMNMAAVNRIECSLVLETDRWNSAKRELVERAFVAGQVSNLKLLLQYFQPSDLWSNTDMEFLKVPTANSESRADNMGSVASSYYNNLTLLNLVRVATYVSESQVPKNTLSDCIRLFWRASETPYASLADIEDAFKPLNRSLLLRHTLMRSCKNQLLEAYPRECLAEYQPRTLKHLSRCEVRQSMISAAFVPSLPLPLRLKWYLNLDI